MRQFTVIAKTFPMVAGDHHEGWTVAGARGVEQRPQRLVDIRDLAVIRPSCVLGVEGRRRRVRRVWVEHVHPGEPSSLPSVNPLERGVRDLSGRTFGEREIGIVAGAAETIVVLV